MRAGGSFVLALSPSRMSMPPPPLLLRLQRLNLQYRWDLWTPLQRGSPPHPFIHAAAIISSPLSSRFMDDDVDNKENTPTLPFQLPAAVTTRRRRKAAAPVSSSEEQQDSQWPLPSPPQNPPSAIRTLFSSQEDQTSSDATAQSLASTPPPDESGVPQSPSPESARKGEDKEEVAFGVEEVNIDVELQQEEAPSYGGDSDAESIIDLTSVPLRGESLSPVTVPPNSTAYATTPLPQPPVPKTPTSQFQVCNVSSSSSDNESDPSDNDLPDPPRVRSALVPPNNQEKSSTGGYADYSDDEHSSEGENSFQLDSPPRRPQQRPNIQRRPFTPSSTARPPLDQQVATPRAKKHTTAAKSSAGAVAQTPRQFRAAREASSEAWRAHFDAQVFGGQLDGKVELKWSNTLRSTAGLCRMMTVKRPAGNGTKTATVERRAIVELAGKVVDCEDRLRETLLHELCHAAAWVVDGVRKPPHGPHFYAWGAKATAATGLPVTRCHAYAIAFKHTWKCVGHDDSAANNRPSSGSGTVLALSPGVGSDDDDDDDRELVMSGGGRGCGAVIGRHSRSVDVTKQVCGRCRGKLEYAGPAATSGSSNSNSGNPRQKKRAPSAFAFFVQTNYASAKLALQHNKRELVTATGSPRRRAPSANSPLPKVAHADVIRALADEWALRDEQ